MMNVWKKGWYAVIRKPSKSILLVALIYCTLMSVVIGISAGHTSGQAQLEARNQVGASFILMLNMENFHDRMEELGAQGYDLTFIPGPPASPVEQVAPPSFEMMTLFLEDIEKLAVVEGVEAYNIQAMMNFQVTAVDFKRIEGQFSTDLEMPVISLIGVRDLSLMSVVEDGSMILSEGRFIQPADRDKLVISEEMATLNQLKIGDTMTLETMPMRDIGMLTVRERLGFEEPGPVQIEGEVVGIFRNNRSISFNPGVISQRSENQIFSNLDFPKVGVHEQDPFYEIATFHVADVEQLETIQARLKAVDINWERYELWENNEAAETLTPAFEQLKETGNVLLGAVLVASFVILSLTFIFLIKGRHHEIGIWLSLGYEKKKIIFQLIWESFLVGFVALLICFTTVSVVATGAQSYFNAHMVSSGSHIEDPFFADQFSFPDDAEEEQITLTITAETLMIAVSITAVLMVVSTALGTIPILCLQPREIFTKLS